MIILNPFLPNFIFTFIINFKHISYIVLVFLLLTLNMYLLAGWSFQFFLVNYFRESISPSVHFAIKEKKLTADEKLNIRKKLDDIEKILHISH